MGVIMGPIVITMTEPAVTLVSKPPLTDIIRLSKSTTQPVRLYLTLL